MIQEIVKELKKTKKNFKIKKAPTQLYPLSVERQYQKELLRYVRSYHDLIKENLYPKIGQFQQEYTIDSYFDETRDITEQVSNTMMINYSDAALSSMLYSIATKTDAFNKKQTYKVLKAMLGVDLFYNDPELRLTIEPFIASNVELIKSMGDDYRKRIRETISAAGRNAYTSAETAKLLEKQFRISKNRARLIARDQIGKFNGQLTRLRHKNVGITEYKWQTSLDERVRGNPAGRYPKARPSHWARQDKRFSYKKPPSGGAPGEPVQCRCWAEPIIKI
jgi:SPP1 gp7 family putative phage head morphogenesis protein